MNCYRCHTPLPDEARFCISCGADLSDPGGAGSSTTAAMDAARAAQLLRMVQEEVGPEFEVEKELGRGGMAVVYLARDVNLDRKVAIKVLPPDLTFGSGAIERFKREARTAATLDHPNIIPIYRISTSGRLFWYAMKYLEGRSLAEILKEQKRLSLSDTIKVLDQVAQALDYAHARRVIHRDIKPANIMLDADKRVIVTDFGIAKQLAAGSFTASGSVIGTPYYMSPEQCTGSKTLTGAADQYSVGVMAYEMLAGQVPFEGDSAVDILTKHVMQPPPPLDVLRPGLPKHVYSAIQRALAKKPEDRFPTVGAFVEALRGAAEITTPIPRRKSLWREAPTTPVPSRPSKRWPRVLALAAIGGAALGTGALWVVNRRPASQLREVASERPDTVAQRIAQQSAALSDTAAGTVPREASLPPPRDTSAAPPAATPQPQSTGPVMGRLQVAGAPRGATLSIDGQPRSGNDFELAPGTYTVRVEAPGYVAAERRITVRPGVTSRLQVRLAAVAAAPPDTARREARAAAGPEPAQPTLPPVPPAPGTVIVRTVGGWARIYINDEFKREGLAHREELPPGDYRIRLERTGYETIDTSVTVVSGETRMLTFTLKPKQFSVLVINTEGGWARIYIDGALKVQGTTYRDTLAPGEHSIRLEREGFVTVDTTVTLAPGQTETVTLTLRRSGS
ncbi:MAG: hypothetical protein KatS3mg081_2595 [Gemmatimonadales bacterium]|nr:MAG: hypothetical protein KatS3mg081_2595 [Gemmatimonadales bacterium]